jgi:hypothetical protein
MMGDKRTMIDQSIAIDTAYLRSGNKSFSDDCRTRAFLNEFYQCQMSRRDCKYSVPLGTSYLCMSPNGREYLL